MSAAERDQAVDDLIGLVGAVDGLLRAQSAADAGYFLAIAGRQFAPANVEALKTGLLSAYRWQYIISGVQHFHFGRLLTGMTTASQMARIRQALAPIVAS